MAQQNVYIARWIAREVSTFSRYYDSVFVWPALPTDSGEFASHVAAKQKKYLTSEEDLPDLQGEKNKRHLILMNGVFNYHHDIQGLLKTISRKLSRNSRIAVVAYSPYLRWAYQIANKLGLRKGELPSTYLTGTDLENLCQISGFSITRLRYSGYFPFHVFGLGELINKVLPAIPVLRNFCISNIILLRPIKPDVEMPSLSIVIPARNEKGNIENALLRMPDFHGAKLEVIFVEGNSSDGTWEEILRVKEAYKNRFSVLAFQQKGKGKNDAVRVGFTHATGDLLTILDADLTMPPELLPRFYESYVMGHADFVNGSRLVYPMEGEAMRFLNRIGNGFFAKALSFVLDARIGDSLCGTKLVAHHDYKRIVEWRNHFGDFDPFGDFELLFPASILGFGIVDIPVRYRARVYGTTNIRRFRDGWILLKMTTVGLLRIKLGGAR